MVKKIIFWCLPCCLLTTYTPTSCSAFSPEMFNQVIAQLGETFSADALAFAAANLFDINTPKRPKIQMKLPKKIISIEPMDIGSFNDILPQFDSIYDDAYQEVRTVANLDMTSQEEELISLLIRVKEKYSKSTTIRIAGGWVRDKLIYGQNTPSRDVDLVLSDISGKDFAEFVVRYIQEEHSEDEYRLHQPNASKGKSDHLQNANLIISGFDVDFCRSRSEKYDKNSRVPSQINVASAVEDAWRRDLTINALYYNINTNQVEDWTEKGVRDLILQRIMTPKKPLPTLLEDPSRILRAVRFAAQLSFEMSPTLKKAAMDVRVRMALQQKVSRDAIGSAMDDMFSSLARDPSRGILLLIEIGLIDVVFPLREKPRFPRQNCDNMELYTLGLVTLQNTQTLITSIFLNYPTLEWDLSQRRLLWYSAFFKPVYDEMPTNIRTKKSKKKEELFYQLLDAMKRPKADVQMIETILRGVTPLQTMMLHPVINSAISPDPTLQLYIYQNKKLLSDLRWIVFSTMKPIGKMWKETLVLSLASSKQSRPKSVQQYKDIVSLIENTLHLGPLLLGKKKMVSILNGKDIQRVMPGKIDGQSFRIVTQAIEEWQIRNNILDEIYEEERDQIEARLVDHLIDIFPQFS